MKANLNKKQEKFYGPYQEERMGLVLSGRDRGRNRERGKMSKKGGGWAEAEATDESKQMLSRFQL